MLIGWQCTLGLTTLKATMAKDFHYEHLLRHLLTKLFEIRSLSHQEIFQTEKDKNVKVTFTPLQLSSTKL